MDGLRVFCGFFLVCDVKNSVFWDETLYDNAFFSCLDIFQILLQLSCVICIGDASIKKCYDQQKDWHLIRWLDI